MTTALGRVSAALQKRAVRILMIDDHSLVRQGLRTVLAEEPDMEVVAEAESGEQALLLAEQLQPDVALLDLTLPDGNGLEFTRKLCLAYPGLLVIILTIHDNEQYLLEALQAGAAGYLLKDSPHQLIPLAIRTVLATGCVVEKRLIARLLVALPSLTQSANCEEAQARLDTPLGERELSVLRLIARGRSNREIGDELHLAESTVKKYVQSLKLKLSVKDRAEAAVLGVRLGLVD